MARPFYTPASAKATSGRQRRFLYNMVVEILPINKVLEEVTSPINGKISVVRSLGLGTYIQVENLTQSGGIVREVWQSALRTVNHEQLTTNSCLILGLGGGTAAMLAKELWPNVKITGVDIDPMMVQLGKKYLGLEGIDAVIEDADNFVLSAVKSSKKYDLILVDTYLGDNFPKKFERDDFFVRLKGILSANGLIIFNRLYYGEKRPEAMKFAAKLERVFSKVKYIFPEANVMFVCYN
jgi:spermidine synthase